MHLVRATGRYDIRYDDGSWEKRLASWLGVRPVSARKNGSVQSVMPTPIICTNTASKTGSKPEMFGPVTSRGPAIGGTVRSRGATAAAASAIDGTAAQVSKVLDGVTSTRPRCN